MRDTTKDLEQPFRAKNAETGAAGVISEEQIYHPQNDHQVTAIDQCGRDNYTTASRRDGADLTGSILQWNLHLEDP